MKRFLNCFITEARHIPQLFDEMKLNAFVASWGLIQALVAQRPQFFPKIEAIARAYISVEQANEAKRPKCVGCPPEGPKPATGKKRNGDSSCFQEHHKKP
ncbi:hypothetical protein Nepgr_007036 [Nepenthes gracilis]|uniref:Uncharacterized protein n=1 Tax=Nepenthes gracilis TaxID=150966 RepID=A0AAD3S6S2_NEPGR|nr:hypothetical protein Nepgr_007036 [Nepenthes gracilis]